MKELDLTDAAVLKWLLRKGGGYGNYDLRSVNNICDLITMTVWSLIRGCFLLWAGMVFLALVVALLVGILITLSVCFSFLTLYLPDGYQSDPETILFGLIALGVFCFILLFTGVILCVQGYLDFSPEYMKRPLHKVLNKQFNELNVTRDKKISPTVVALKEMGLSFKNKTCIKIKLEDQK